MRSATSVANPTRIPSLSRQLTRASLLSCNDSATLTTHCIGPSLLIPAASSGQNMRTKQCLLQFALIAILCTGQAPKDCRCFPGDTCWPTLSDWDRLNETLDGKLVATVPLAAPCHDPIHNKTRCQVLRDNWQWPREHYESSSSVMAPFFTNQSCDPFTPEHSPCLFGNYVRYAINVSSALDVATGIRFAKERNIRLVIRNTGHEYVPYFYILVRSLKLTHLQL